MSDEEEMNTMLYDPYGHYKPSNLLHKNTVPGDRFFPGGWAGKIYQLWLIVVPLILDFCLWWYILQWQFLVTVILTWDRSWHCARLGHCCDSTECLG
jgi:hypothetical protein